MCGSMECSLVGWLDLALVEDVVGWIGGLGKR